MKILNRPEYRQPANDMSVPRPPYRTGDRTLRSIGREASVVTLQSAAPASSLYGANGVVPGDPGATSGILAQIRQRLKDEYPDLRHAARQALEGHLRDAYKIDVDADHTWFNTFASAVSSPRSYNGWEHSGQPLVSLSLTDLQLQNFPADFGGDPNGLNAGSGVYRAGASATRFDENNEVRLLSSDLKAAIRGSDFQSAYRTSVESYWRRNENAVALHYESLALEHSQDGSLSPPARRLLAQAAGYHDGGKSTWNAYTFDINSYPSRNMAWLQAADGRVVLFTPHGAEPLREYASVGEMRRGIVELTRTEAGRDEILRGFSIYNQQDGTIYQGVEKWLGDIAGGGYDERIAMRPGVVAGNLFADLARRSKEAAIDDVSRLIRSNSDIGKQEMMQALRAFNDIMGSPVTQVAEAGYALYAARTEGLREDRQDAASRAWVAGLSAAVMLALDGAGRRLATAGLPEPVVLYKPPTRLPDGRFGYPLGPIDAPRLPERPGMQGSSAERPPPAADRSGSPDDPLDLSRQRWARRYREPENGFAAPYADFPPPGPADAQVIEPLDLSSAPRPPSVVQAEHARVAPEVNPAQPVSPVQPGQINSLGFRERSDFQDLYGFQSYGGSRLSRTVAGLELNRNSSGIGQMIEGDMLRTYTTIEAAEEAARRTPLQHYRLIHIRAEGLRAVSFQDNRLNNPLLNR